ncbi:MAG: DnaJ domain-containing protein [Kineosporiaceae bacterium]|nr:DnaJ domain-containing protein [Aeromicrobium sp.]
MTFINYYEVLELDKNSNAEAIKEAVRKQRREWRNRQGHPKAETRALAEKMTQHISDAEATLLDSAKRADYDRQLAAQASVPVQQPSAGPGGRDWVEIARQYLDSGNASQANYAAREATTQQSENPDAWYVRGMSSHILSNYADADFELGEAIRLNPNDPTYHCEMGDLYSSADQAPRAQQAYQRASDLDPSNLFYQVGVASTLTAQGHAGQAVPILKKAVDANPDNDLFIFHYAIAALDSTTDQWSQFADGSSSITNDAQLALTRTNLRTVEALRVSDPELKEHIDEISRMADKAERVKWFGSDNILGYLGGLAVTFVGVLICFGIASGGNGGAGFVGFLFLVALVLIPVIFVRRHRMPGWKWEQKHVPAFVRQSGLQQVGGQ